MILFRKSLLSNSIVYFCILIICFLFYGTTLSNQYNIDDNYVMLDQPLSNQGIEAIPEIFTSNYINKKNESHSYRPVTLTTFAIEYEFFGANPFVSHLLNVLLYSLCCFLVYRFILHLDPQGNHQLLAITSTFVFLVLPVHSEVVNNVKCRDELLCFCFALLTCIQFVRYGRSKSLKYTLLGALLLVASFLSKPSSFPLLAVIPIMMALFTPARKRFVWGVAGSLTTVYVALRLARKYAVSDNLRVREIKFFENPLFDRETYSFVDRIPVAITTYWEYLRLLVYPEKLISYYGYNQFEIATWTDTMVWVILLFICCLLAVVLKFWKKKPFLVFGILWFSITISMFTNLVKPVVGIIGERFAFLPSFGFSLFIGVLLVGLFKTSFFSKLPARMGLAIVLASIVILNGYQVNKRSSNWYDFETLMTHDTQVAPDSAKLQALLANHLFRKIRNEDNMATRYELVEQASNLYQRSVEIYPGYYKSWNNMGTLVLNEFSDYEKALGYYKKAIQYKPDYKDALFGAGYASEVLGDKASALNYYGRLMEIDPGHLNVAGRILQLQSN